MIFTYQHRPRSHCLTAYVSYKGPCLLVADGKLRLLNWKSAAAIAAVAAVAAARAGGGHAANTRVVAATAAATATVVVSHTADTRVVVAAADPDQNDRDDDPPSVIRPAIKSVTHDCLPPKFDFTSYYGSAHQLVHGFAQDFSGPPFMAEPQALPHANRRGTVL